MKIRYYLGDHWLDKDGKILILDSQRTGSPHDIRPGEIVSMEIPISAGFSRQLHVGI